MVCSACTISHPPIHPRGFRFRDLNPLDQLPGRRTKEDKIGRQRILDLRPASSTWYLQVTILNHQPPDQEVTTTQPAGQPYASIIPRHLHPPTHH